MPENPKIFSRRLENDQQPPPIPYWSEIVAGRDHNHPGIGDVVTISSVDFKKLSLVKDGIKKQRPLYIGGDLLFMELSYQDIQQLAGKITEEDAIKAYFQIHNPLTVRLIEPFISFMITQFGTQDWARQQINKGEHIDYVDRGQLIRAIYGGSGAKQVCVVVDLADTTNLNYGELMVLGTMLTEFNSHDTSDNINFIFLMQQKACESLKDSLRENHQERVLSGGNWFNLDG